MKTDDWKNILRQHGCLVDGRIVCPPGINVDFYVSGDSFPAGAITVDMGDIFAVHRTHSQASAIQVISYYSWNDVVRIKVTISPKR